MAVRAGPEDSCGAPINGQFLGFCLDHSLAEASAAYQEAIKRWVKTGQQLHFQELIRANKEVQKEGTAHYCEELPHLLNIVHSNVTSWKHV